jgi:hypothetical protein
MLGVAVACGGKTGRGLLVCSSADGKASNGCCGVGKNPSDPATGGAEAPAKGEGIFGRSDPRADGADDAVGLSLNGESDNRAVDFARELPVTGTESPAAAPAPPPEAPLAPAYPEGADGGAPLP